MDDAIRGVNERHGLGLTATANEKHMKMISIIMPVYNAEKYLKESIESILNQTYTNYEFILVNDGSTDNSLNILQQYSKRDKRIRVFNQENAGCAAARNNALNKVEGEYIVFVDSDDIVHPMLLEALMNDAIEYNSDISICCYQEFVDSYSFDKMEPSCRCIEMNSEQAIEALNDKKMTAALWSKLYKKELFVSERLPLITTSEDIFLAYKLIVNSKIITLNSSKLYLYRKNINSISNTKVNFNFVSEGEKITKYIKKSVPYRYEKTVRNYLLSSIAVYNSMYLKNNFDYKNARYIRKIVGYWFDEIKESDLLDSKDRLKVVLFTKFPLCYCFIFNFFRILGRYK